MADVTLYDDATYPSAGTTALSTVSFTFTAIQTTQTLSVYYDEGTIEATFSHDDTTFVPLPKQQWFTIWERHPSPTLRNITTQFKSASGTPTMHYRWG